MNATLASCPCNICSGIIEFEPRRAGDTVECPHCAMETQLFISQAQPPQIVQTTLVVPPTARTGETAFLNDRGLVITKTRFIVGVQTYSVSNITSVLPIQIDPSRVGPLVALLFAVLAGLIGIAMVRDTETVGGGIVFLIAAALSLALSIFLFIKIKAKYAIVISSSAGEIQAYVSPDANFIWRAVAALNDAIAARG